MKDRYCSNLSQVTYAAVVFNGCFFIYLIVLQTIIDFRQKKTTVDSSLFIFHRDHDQTKHPSDSR